MKRFIVFKILFMMIALSGYGQINLQTQVRGVLPVKNGGTGTTLPNAFSLTAGQLATKFSTDYAWTRSPADDLTSPGPQTVNLSSCPLGVFGTWPGPSYYPDPRLYYVYVSNTGTPEPVQITGGTCAGNGQPGTLQFTTANAHPNGYTLSSASAGIAEASNAAAVTLTSGNNFPYKMQEGKIVVPPGLHQLYWTLSLINNSQTIEFQGAVVCNFDADCINTGDPAHYQASNFITLIRPSGVPGFKGGTHAFIVDFANHTRIQDLSSTVPPLGPCLSAPTCTFGYGIEVVGDQAAVIDGVQFDAIRCDVTFCGSKIYAPGPFIGHAGTPYTGGDNSAVAFISHLEAGNCAGNGVDWQSGNMVRISDSVVQGYSQFGIRWSRIKGGFGMMVLDNVYEEAGCGTPPQGNVGHAGLIVQGGRVSIHGGEMPSGDYPVFANTGATVYYYYVIATDGANGSSNLLYAGTANSNGSGNINVLFNQLPAATSYDLLVSTQLYQAPFGTGNWAAATGVSSASACVNNVCTITDTQARSSYTVVTPTYFPQIPLWGGGMVIGPAGAANSVAANGSVALDFNDLNSISISQVNTAGSTSETVNSLRCILLPGSPIRQSCTGQDQDLAATILFPGTAPANLKGRLNFGTWVVGGPTHLITLRDSNFAKTLGFASNRPANDANDTFIGTDNDQAHLTQLTFGAPLSISEYIGNVGDGTNWKERLIAGLKTFQVPVRIVPMAFSALASCAAGTEGEQASVNDSSTNTWGATVTGGGSNHVLAYCDGSSWTVMGK